MSLPREGTKLTAGERRAWRAGAEAMALALMKQLEEYRLRFHARGVLLDAPRLWPAAVPAPRVAWKKRGVR